MPHFIRKTSLFFICFLSFFSNAQTQKLSSQSTISVLTCATGNESYALFGHTAVRVTDVTIGLDLVYNYGSFDFATPNFVLRFAKGDLQYFATVSTYADFINEYIYLKRSVFEQKLQLPLPLKQEIYNNLSQNIQSTTNFYTYKFIDKNCTTMVIELLNTALKQNVIAAPRSEQSYRSILYPYFDGHFYEKLGTSILFGTKVDHSSNHVFLPFELKNALNTAQYKQQKLAQKTTTLLNFAPEKTTSYWNNFYSYIGFLILILILHKTKAVVIFFSLLGLLGVLFLAAGWYSQHLELANNYNALLFNPLLLVLSFFILKKNKDKTALFCKINLAFVLLYGVFCSNKAHFLIILPLLLTVVTLLLLVLKRIVEKNKN